MRKKDIVAFVLLGILTLYLVFCWLFYWFRWSSNLISSAGDIVVHALAWLNMMEYKSHIGGHHAHLHWLVLLANLFVALIYAVVTSCVINKRRDCKKKIPAFCILVFLASLTVYLVTTFNFFIELERFAYSFFVPQV